MFDHQYASAEGLPDRLAIAVRKIEFARNYTRTLLEGLNDDDWFWMPPEYPTHIAWQVGHLAMSEYGLTLFQQRGRDREVDAGLMTSRFRKMFMRGTTPSADRETHPTPSEILETLERVHHQMRREVPTFSLDALDEPLGPPTSAFATRYGALLFAGDHEMLHAGQIGVLRRLMGKDPVR